LLLITALFNILSLGILWEVVIVIALSGLMKKHLLDNKFLWVLVQSNFETIKTKTSKVKNKLTRLKKEMGPQGTHPGLTDTTHI